ncbi:MAG: BlaI/MecI/CopY family transcriptional regulator [Pirellulaceae bacterium]
MARPKSEHPTELELRILKILWDRSPLPVREIRQGLADGGHVIAHTSTITTLNAMVKKRYLRRQMQANACLFSPRVAREEVSRRMLTDVVRRVFDGSAKEVVLSLFDQQEIDVGELKELRSLINRKLKRQS